MSRTQNMVRNMKWSYIGTFSTMVLGFVVRTVLIYSLGKTFLGLNSLYASVIGVLSIAELGVGGILNTQLYKPVAENDEKTIIVILQLYKKIYRFIAFAVLAIGLALFPFLEAFLKGAEDIAYVKLYYLFFLFNTVTTYFVSYKFSISNAEQKNYINTNFDTISTLVMYVLQIMSLILYKSYFLFMFVNSLTIFVKAMVITIYMNNRYPILKAREKCRLEQGKMQELKKNIIGGVANRFSDSAINQTDSMIISAFVNIDSLGLASNYVVLRSYVEKFTKPLLDNHGSTIGNYVSMESKDRKVLLVKTLQLYSFLIYGLSALLLYFISTPFIRIWLGEDMTVTNDIVLMIALGLLVSGVGDRPYVLFKGAHGIFYDDWYVSFATAFVNLTVSIILAIPLGIVGVYIGTVCTNLVSVIWRPFIFYKKSTGESVSNYFIRLIRNLGIVFVCGAGCSFVFSQLQISSVILEIFIKGLVISICFVALCIIVFFRTEEFKYIVKLLKQIIFRRKEL